MNTEVILTLARFLADAKEMLTDPALVEVMDAFEVTITDIGLTGDGFELHIPKLVFCVRPKPAAKKPKRKGGA